MTKTKPFVEGVAQHVVHNSGPGGGWQVKGEGNEGATHVRAVKMDAIEIGRQIAMSNYTQLIIHDKDGNITDREDYSARIR